MTHARSLLVAAAATLATTATLGLPTGASAGKPYVLGDVGPGAHPTVTAGAPGVVTVVWNDPAASVVHVCQVLAGKSGCAKSTVLPFNDSAKQDATGEPGRAYVVRDPATGTLFLVLAQYVSSDTYVWTSTDDGTSFAGPVKVYGGVNGRVGTEAERPLLRPATASLAVPTSNPGLYVVDAKLDGSTAAAEATADLDQSGLGNRSYNLGLAALATGTLATADDLQHVVTWQAPDGSPLSATPSWGGPQLVTAGTDSTMHGAGTQTFLAYTTDSGGKTRLEIRRWGGLSFGAPTVLAKERTSFADVSVSAGGAPGVIFRRNGTGLRYAFSADGGKTYGVKTVAASDELFPDLALAHDDSGAGLAVWTRTGAIAAADLTEVPDKRAPAVSTTATKHGRTLGLDVPGSCVVPGKPVTVTAGGQGQGALQQVKYTFGAQQQTDTHQPWSATFKVPKGAKAGTTIKVTALGTLKTRTTTFTILVASSVRVCGG